jgi:hypothetical protein
LSLHESSVDVDKGTIGARLYPRYPVVGIPEHTDYLDTTPLSIGLDPLVLHGIVGIEE